MPASDLNCLLTSSIIWFAALPTEFIVKAENMNGSIAPMNSPMITIGLSSEIADRPVTAEYDANRARAVSAAEPIANPLPIAAVVFPTASSLSVMLRTPSGSSDISAIPPALSDTGP